MAGLITGGPPPAINDGLNLRELEFPLGQPGLKDGHDQVDECFEAYSHGYARLIRGSPPRTTPAANWRS